MRDFVLVLAACAVGMSPLPAQVPAPTGPDSAVVRLRRENDSLRAVLDSLRRGPPAIEPGPRLAPLDLPGAALGRKPSPVVPPAPTERHPGRIAVEFDRFRDYTVVSLERLNLSGGLDLSAYYLTPGTQASVPRDVTLTFTANSSDWRYLRCHSVDMLADGQPLAIPPSTHDGRVGRGYVLEFVRVRLPVAEFLRLAAARAVDGRICNTEFQLRAPELTALTDLASRMR